MATIEDFKRMYPKREDPDKAFDKSYKVADLLKAIPKVAAQHKADPELAKAIEELKVSLKKAAGKDQILSPEEATALMRNMPPAGTQQNICAGSIRRLDKEGKGI